MRERHRRAWEPFSRYEVFLIAVIPVIAGAIVLWAGTKDEADSMTTAVYPTIGFGLAALAMVLGFHFLPYCWRMATGRPVKGRGRNLVGARGKEKVEAALGKHNPGGVHNLVTALDTVEVRDFVRDIRELMRACGWQMDTDYVWITSEAITDVLIDLPTGGNDGLQALAEFIRGAGYKVTVKPSEYDGAPNGAGSPTAWIYVGEATH